MKSCFDNYITLDPESSPRSGLKVTDLPGVSINQFVALINDEVDLNEFYSKLYKRAKNSFLNRITNKLSPSFKSFNITDNEVSGMFNKDLILNENNGDAGVLIRTVKSKYSVVEINYIEIYSVTPVTNALINIVDNDNGWIIKTIQTDLEAGVNFIDVNEDFTCENILVVYDPMQVQSIETLEKTVTGCCNRCSKGIEQINGGGLIVSFNSKCSIESFVCSRMSLFRWPFLYWLGIELMTERLTSENTNCFTIDIEEAKRLLALYESEFDRSFPLNISIKDDPKCFDCRGAVTKKVLLP